MSAVHLRPAEAVDSPSDERVARSAQGVKAVRRITLTSNEVAVHLIEVDVLPGPGWADLSSDSHSTLSVVLEETGGHVETRLKRKQASPDEMSNICFTPPGTPIWGYSDGVRRVRELRLDLDLPRAAEALGQQLIMPTAPRLFRDDRLHKLAEFLAEECAKGDHGNPLYVDSLTAAVCIDFLRLDPGDAARPVGRLAPWQLRQVTEHITEHLAETVRLKDLAAIAGLSQSQFGRAFKASTGLSPHRWQLDARVAEAQRLLRERSMPHGEIALATGFSEQSHFIRVFKNLVGTTPRVWQRENLRPAGISLPLRTIA